VSNRRRTAALAGAAASVVLGGLLGTAGPAGAAWAAPQAPTTGTTQADSATQAQSTTQAGSATRAQSVLTLTVRAADGRSSVTLRCAPIGGTHPQSRAACAAVAQAKGDLTALPAQEGVMCTMIYAPVTATARGTWHGKPVRYQHTFGNACTMHAATGAVFDF
jgi:hypothetical protein